jgi:Ca-activated chloride channel homolog
MRLTKMIQFIFAMMMLFALTSCGGDQPSSTQVGANIACPSNAITITMIYSPEGERYLIKAMEDFNRLIAQGTNPVTGQPLAQGQSPVCVTGTSGSAGTVMQGIINAHIAPNNANVQQPIIWVPSVSHWLALTNFQSGREIFDLSEARPSALAPVVMAIWESRLNAIRETVGYEEIGWEELLGVLHSPNGWQDYGISGRRTVYYGHTDPMVSSTALSTLIAEFYASARERGFTERRLTLDQVNSEDVQQGVRDIEQLIRHYAPRTTEFIQYIAQGPEYLDFVALEENDLIYINRGLTDTTPPERLVALYPKEGTFWHEHPMAIPNASWVSDQQRQGANLFIDYVLSEDVQRAVMESGFRPANPDVEIGFPFVEENGVDPAGPATVLDVPDADVIAAIQQSWAFVKKQADILLVIDISGSMESDNKIGQAREAALTFLENMEPTNRVGLVFFSDDVDFRIDIDDYETNAQQLRSNIQSLRTIGGTELYMAVRDAVKAMSETEDEGRIRAVVILSDGQDTGEHGITLNDAVSTIAESRNTLNPVIVIPVAYGSDADINALNTIARASNTRVVSGDPENIGAVLELISSFF